MSSSLGYDSTAFITNLNLEELHAHEYMSSPTTLLDEWDLWSWPFNLVMNMSNFSGKASITRLVQ